MEAAAAFWASAFLGAVIVPIVHFYGRKELAHILAHREAAGVHHRRGVRADDVSARPVRGRADRRPGRKDTDERSREEHAFDDLLADEPMAGTVADRSRQPGADRVHLGHDKQIRRASSTAIRRSASRRVSCSQNYPPDRGRQLTATPVGHFIGMLGAFLIPVLEGAPIDLCDVWDPGKVLKLIESDGLSIGGGPPYFVTSLLDHPDCTPEHTQHFTTVGLGGSTVPPRSPGGWPTWACSCSAPTAAPSTRRSPVRAPTAPEDKRLFTDGNAAARRRDPARTRRRDLQPRPGSVPRLHRSPN